MRATGVAAPGTVPTGLHLAQNAPGGGRFRREGGRR
jgi:hypothetical protein